MITTAVILAAGCGIRCGRVSREAPKGFLTIGNEAIVAESIGKLRSFGITRVLIGTGYKREYYDNLARQFPGIICICNEQYATSGSMATLRTISDHVQSDVLLLESDIIYERRALRVVIDAPEHDVVLTSEVTAYGDEVYVGVNRDARLTGMSKDSALLRHIDGVLVGISKISLGTLQAMCSYFDRTQDVAMNYEDALVGVAASRDIQVRNAGRVAWCEIDTPEHFVLASQVIYPAVQRLDGQPGVARNVLLNPGPATTSDTVKYAQVVPDICPREKEFGTVLTEVGDRLTDLAAGSGSHVPVLFGGSGTASVEAVLSSVIGDDDFLCVVDNGAYGARMCEIAGIYRIPMMRYEADPLRGVNTEHLANVLSHGTRKVTHLAVVHHETTTGVLNDIEAIGRVCARHNIVLLVDAISSFGAIPLDMPGLGIHFLVATANKNLQGMPGVSFVIADRLSLERTKTIPPRNLYLNLYRQYESFVSTGQMRFTPPVQTCYALRQALIELSLEGISERYRRYEACWQVLVEGLVRLGLQMPVPVECQSRLLTSVLEPSWPGFDFDRMHDMLKRRGFTVYPGKLPGLRSFRVANIGAITPQDMRGFLQALEEYLSLIVS